jgi:hypothetical protein
MVLLALLPVLAHSPAWWDGRLLGPGDGAALHYPLRAEAWAAYGRGELPAWNPSIFSGTPLLAAYRPGVFYPPMAALSALPAFTAFQLLVLGSLSAAAALTFLYVRRLRVGVVGAYFAALSFSLGPYLVGHLGDTATLVAAPTLPLVLLAAESHMRRPTPRRAAGLAAAFALLLLAGSPEAARAGGALLAGRLLVGFLFPGTGGRMALRSAALAIFCGGLLAAPQIVPTLIAAPEAGRQVSGLAGGGGDAPSGASGLVLRYLSHTPAPALALSALPLALTQTPVRVFGIALGLCLALQWGRGPLAAPGAAALVFDLTLSILAGLSLGAQWEARREKRGARLRLHFLFWSLASAAALSVSAAALGPLPQTLAGSVGVLALSLILYFSLAASSDPVAAGVWLLPLTVSFLLQPHGRDVWADAPRGDVLLRGTLTREAFDRAMGQLRSERILTLATAWPSQEALDLAYANLGALAQRRSANGYDPMVPLRSRAAFDGMGAGGTLPTAFLRTDPGRLELLGIRWVQVPAAGLVARADPWGLGEVLEIAVEPGRPLFFPLPIVPATEVRLGSHMSDSLEVRDEEPVARVSVRLATGRELPLWLRAGRDTGEWAHDRPDVRDVVSHRRPLVLDSWRDSGAGFEGHRYLATLALPGRYRIDGVRVERLAGPGRLLLGRLSVFDAAARRATAVSLAGAYVSDTSRFVEAAALPAARLYELPHGPGRVHVAERLRILPDDQAVLGQMRATTSAGIDTRREALATSADAQGIVLPPAATGGRAELVRSVGSRIDVRAEGPGLLVIGESWDPGWSARIDGRPARLFRVNHVQMGLVLEAGTHRVALRYGARGLAAGVALAAVAGIALARGVVRRRDG